MSKAKRRSTPLKTKSPRRAAKPKDDASHLDDAMRDVFRKLDEMGHPLHDARGAANAAELIGDEASDSFIQAALHCVSHHAQQQIDAVQVLVDEALEIITATAPFRRAHAETLARLAAAEGGAS